MSLWLPEADSATIRLCLPSGLWGRRKGAGTSRLAALAGPGLWVLRVSGCVAFAQMFKWRTCACARVCSGLPIWGATELL